jgi:hypothetical protein
MRVRAIKSMTDSEAWQAIQLVASACSAFAACAAVSIAMGAVSVVVDLSQGDFVGASIDALGVFGGVVGFTAKKLGALARTGSKALKNLSKKGPSWPFVWKVTKKLPHDVAKTLDKFADKMDRIEDQMGALG